MVDIHLDDITSSQRQPFLVGSETNGNRHNNRDFSQPKMCTIDLQLSDRIIPFPSGSTSKQDFASPPHQPPKENSISSTEPNKDLSNKRLYTDMSTTDWLCNNYHKTPRSTSQIHSLTHAALHESRIIKSARRQSSLSTALAQQRQASLFHYNNTRFPSLDTNIPYQTTTTTTNHPILHSPFFHIAFLLFLFGALSSVGVSIPLIQTAPDQGAWKMDNPLLLAMVITGCAFAVGSLWLFGLAVEYKLFKMGWARRLGERDWYGGGEVYRPRSWMEKRELGEESGGESGLRYDLESGTFYRTPEAERQIGDLPAYIMPYSSRGSVNEVVMYSDITEAGYSATTPPETPAPPTCPATTYSRSSRNSDDGFRILRKHVEQMEEIKMDIVARSKGKGV
ncbi:hypothetical protein BJ875DRAFT_465838 [Amylocarpus encephaloides]|uniref:Uncharacterized protein n=1 Tax=Amylocarpus encephaloides TaxID=45428 RepID=A0A9P7YFR1_9HELO|nr:hypothetical protein BJ875DRAFT_465838 [Amylocarpus encephaloides]